MNIKGRKIKMAVAKWKTLKEIESEYQVSASSLRVYINKGMIYKYHIKKIGTTWLINENYIKQKYKKR